MSSPSGRRPIRTASPAGTPRVKLHTAMMVLAWSLAIVLPTAAVAERPQRIVSLHLCADQYLLALADPSQIAALTVLAADPAMSWLAEPASAFPRIRGTAEEVTALDPDLVLAGTFTRRHTRDLLTRLGYRVETIGLAETIDDVVATTRRVAALVGRPGRGEALVAELADNLAEAQTRTAPLGPPLSALAYQRRGVATGVRSLTTALLRRTGFRNAAADFGLTFTASLALERVVASPPDTLLTATATAALIDLGTEMLLHPALAAAVPPDRRITLPTPLVTCGGPMTATAIAHLTAERLRLGRADGSTGR